MLCVLLVLLRMQRPALLPSSLTSSDSSLTVPLLRSLRIASIPCLARGQRCGHFPCERGCDDCRFCHLENESPVLRRLRTVLPSLGTAHGETSSVRQCFYRLKFLTCLHLQTI
ncbi:hypothetical protein EJ05DRAFT_217671 [Pseudovirgaria hyperparasitica]|uniref:C3H1-type domain-containing protein n=1 Tax=Pseudovirgaria hyperparasitica TaxID=470096 RepID=A0A6A6VW63_9PEZI|nr:uncharacterized protein EJ05DRAFT_217671 [Pseudovirgaria hyperparasitica]KAF2753481.1 hypothetical protein EJ05DRAFT_217671 [Pseudovirgaria hyperparasitica]